MSTYEHATARAPLPYTEAVLREIDVVPERHHVKRHVSSNTARFDVGAANETEPPVVTTRLIRAHGCGTDHAWQVEVSVDGRQLRRTPPPALKVVQVHRSILARHRVTSLAASMPHFEGRIAVRPQLRRLPEPYLIRFGDLRYQPTTIFNPDGRRPYYDESYPWRCLVRITTPRGWSGSGVLIGPRHVLTASHCVDWTPGWMTVDVMYSSAHSLASANGIYAYAESRVGPGTIPDDESDEDYAVIVLDQPLGEQYGWFGSRTYDSGWDDETSAWHSIGYPQDWSGNGEIAAWQTDFFLNELGADFGSARLIRTQTFDNWPGQSGSPIFGFWDGGPSVVGVVSGQGSDYNYISGGSLLPSLVNRARNEQP
jgi:V8-like Glu-specific endopeptidase